MAHDITCEEAIANDLILNVKYAMLDMRTVAIISTDTWIKSTLKDAIYNLSTKIGGWLPERMDEI